VLVVVSAGKRETAYISLLLTRTACAGPSGIEQSPTSLRMLLSPPASKGPHPNVCATVDLCVPGFRIRPRICQLITERPLSQCVEFGERHREPEYDESPYSECPAGWTGIQLFVARAACPAACGLAQRASPPAYLQLGCVDGDTCTYEAKGGTASFYVMMQIRPEIELWKRHEIRCINSWGLSSKIIQ